MMSIVVECAGCKNQFYAPRTAAGKFASCPQCSQKINIPIPAPSPAVPAKPGRVVHQKPAAVAVAKSTSSQATAAAVLAPKPSANAGRIESRWKIPRISRGMRWFLVIVVGPIVGIFLLGEIVPPIIRMFRGSPAPAASGSFGPSSAERDALLQQLADEEQAANNRQRAMRESPVKGTPLINGHRLGISIIEFRSKYPDQDMLSQISQLINSKGNYGVQERILSVFGSDVFGHYLFHDGKLSGFEAELGDFRVAELMEKLTAELRAPPVEIAVQDTSEAISAATGEQLPQLRWENQLVRVTLTPIPNQKYKYKVLHKVFAKRMIDYHADMGNPLK